MKNKIGSSGTLEISSVCNHLILKIPGESDIVIPNGVSVFIFKRIACHLKEDDNEPEKKIYWAKIPGYKIRFWLESSSFKGDWERIDDRVAPEKR